MSKSYELDMTTGSVFKKLVIYCIPIILTNLIQVLFHSADIFIDLLIKFLFFCS